MKRKLLFAAMLIAGAFGLKVHAQQWLASAPQDGGTYYLYNVGANAYLSNGYYGEASLKTKGGIAVTLHQNGDAYDIYTSSVYNGSYMVENVSSHWVFLDVALGSYAYYQPWYFVPVDGKPDTYLLRTSGRYLTIFQGSNTETVDYAFRTQTVEGTPNEMGYWKLVTKENRLAGASQRKPVDATFLLGVADEVNALNGLGVPPRQE